MNPTEGPQRAVTVKAPFEGQPPADASASVFVFDPHGTLVSSAPLKGGQAALSIPQSLGTSARVMIGPTPQKTDKPYTLDSLQRLHGYQPSVTIDAKSGTIDIKPIPQALWKYWRWYLCRIRGKVVRNINGVDYPVCNARVRVREVEPFWLILQKLPDAQLLTLRDHVLQAVATSSMPIPRPGPLSFAGPRLPTALQPKAAAPAAAPLPAAALATLLASKVNMTSAVSVATAHALPAQTVAALTSTSPSLVRNALVSNIALYRPYLCLWSWWWWLFNRCEEIGTVMTDDHGNFDLDHWELDGDDEDLYFSVDYNLGGTWTSVYAPPLPCNVYWDYACGSDVTIRITDTRVPVCGNPADLPGMVVELMSIGNNLSPVIGPQRQIDSSGLTTPTAATPASPFGGSIEPHVEFSATNLASVGITHYLWSYRRMTNADGTPSGVPVTTFTPISTPVYRHYRITVPGPPPLFVFPTEQLGPDPALGGLFKIQSAVGPGDGWSVTGDARADTASAFFRTDDLAPGDPDSVAGTYELKLELFRATDPTHPVNFNDEHITPSLANIPAPFGANTISAVVADDEHVFKDLANKVTAMRWVLHIDNNVCHGNINDVQVAGGTLGPCGFYTIPSQSAGVTVSFTASHPRGYAKFDFDLARGSSGVIDNLGADGLVTATPVNSYALSGTTFSRTFVAHDLFNIVDGMGPQPGCDRGAFAAFLYVHALATDGWSVLSGLDGPRGGPSEIGLKAFALMP
jgi:hypothetical protein